MRRFSKKLAFALAAAMVLVTAAPAAQAKAASDFSLNRTSATLYVNKGVNDADKVAEGLAGNVQKYDFNLKNKPADWKDYGYAWSTSNDKVATVVSGGVTTAVGVGKATISCVITDKATGEIVDTLKATVNVKANASKVTITNPDVDGTTVKVGDTVDLNRSMSDEKGMTSSKRGQYVTDLTKWVVEPAEGVTVDQSTGKFTFTEAAKAGDYTLSCYTYQSDKYPTKTAESDKITVTLVKNTSFEVEQVTASQFTLKFADAVKSLGALNVVRILTIGDADYEIPVVTDAPALAKDGMSATVNFLAPAATANNEVYKFTIDGFDAPVKKTVKIGVASVIKVTADASKGADYPIVVGTTGTLVATLYDANGVNVTEAAKAKSGAYIEFLEKTPSEEGKYSVGADGSIWFEGANIPCEVEVVYHSGEYDDNGEEINTVRDTFTFVSQAAPAQVVTGVSATIKVGETDLKSTSVALGTEGAYLEVKPAISNKAADKTAVFVNNQQYETYGVVSFEETNNNYFAVSRDEGDSTLYLFQEGEGQVVIYITNDKGVKTVVGVVTVKVTPAKALNKVSLETNTVTVGMVQGLDEATVKFVAKNNYNEDYKENDYAVKIEPANNLAKKVGAENAAIYFDGTAIKIDGSEFGAAFLNEAAVSATLTYKVKVSKDGKSWESLLTITVKKENSNAKATYSFEKAAGNWGDVTRLADKDKDGVKSITFEVYEMNNGVKVAGVAVNQYVDKSKLTEADNGKFFVKVAKNGQDISDKKGSVDFGSFAVSGSAVSGSSVTLTFSGAKDGFVDYSVMGAGNYTITLYQCAVNNGVPTYRTLRTISGATTVDEGKYTLVSVKEGYAASASDADLRECFNINGRNGENTKNNSFVVDATESAASNTVFVKSITFFETVGTEQIAYKVVINKPVTLKAE